jgi:hypothetical protein
LQTSKHKGDETATSGLAVPLLLLLLLVVYNCHSTTAYCYLQNYKNKEDETATSGLVVPLLPFGMPKYDAGERFDLRSPYADDGWVDPDETGEGCSSLLLSLVFDPCFQAFVLSLVSEQWFLNSAFEPCANCFRSWGVSGHVLMTLQSTYNDLSAGLSSAERSDIR